MMLMTMKLEQSGILVIILLLHVMIAQFAFIVIRLGLDLSIVLNETMHII